MQQDMPTWLGSTSPFVVAVLAVFVFFGFRKGMQVKWPSEGVPPERTNLP